MKELRHSERMIKPWPSSSHFVDDALKHVAHSIVFCGSLTWVMENVVREQMIIKWWRSNEIMEEKREKRINKPGNVISIWIWDITFPIWWESHN